MFAKMAKNDMLKEEKRLNNEEFIELLPHLEPYETLMIQVKFMDTWRYLFWYNRSKSTIACIICGIKLYGTGFIEHGRNDAHHLHNLKKVEQFYHPVYTYAKISKTLAQGLKVMPSELNDATTVAKEEMKKSFDYDYKNAQTIMQKLGNADPKDLSKDDKRLISLALNSKIKDVDQMCINVGIPMSALEIMEYSVKENEWMPMLQSNDWSEKSSFYCNICSKQCVGILTVNAHLNGWQHKSLQLQTLGVRVRSFKHLTKNCCFRYNKHYSLALKDKANIFLQAFMNDNNIECTVNIEDMETDLMKMEKPYLSPTIAAKAKALCAHAMHGAKEMDKGSSTDTIENEGLIGVEYVVKLMKSDDDENPMYECCLCRVGMNEMRMQNHLINYNHRIKYCETHYPDTLNKYKNQMGSLKYYDYFRVMQPILAKLAWAIEQHHGRSLPYTMAASKFKKTRSDIQSKVFDFLHACQSHGPSFANIVSKEEIANFIENKQAYKQSIASNDPQRKFTTVPTDKVYLNQRHNNPNVREEDRQKKLTKTIMPSTNIVHSSNKRLRSRSPRDHCEIETRSGAARDKSTEVENLYRQYRKNPESHPLYDKEWDKFWRQRKEELISLGIDHRTYNYQPEWVHYFRGRVEELFEEDLLEEKIKMKQIIERKRSSPSRSISSSKQILDKNMYSDNNESKNTIQPNKRLRSEEININTQWDATDDQSNSSAKWSHNVNTVNQSQIPSITDGKANVIHCLRLLVAFEDHLGSLGSKVIDLLSKGLVLEKTCRNPRELEEKILNATNCTLLETAMEKLKGILYAGLLDNNKVIGFNRVIHHTSELLQHADTMGWRSIPQENTDKLSSHVQLDQLINAVQTKQRMGLNSSNEKSLSDTLMELMSARKPNNSDTVQNRNIILPTHNRSGTMHSNASVSSQSFGRRNENNDMSHFNTYTGLTKPNMGNFTINRVNNTGLSNFNTSLTTENQMFRSSDNFGNGAGRNNYNDQYNNYNQLSNFGYQSEYGQSSSNINLTNNGKVGFRKATGNNSNGSGGTAESNWKGFRNNDHW